MKIIIPNEGNVFAISIPRLLMVLTIPAIIVFSEVSTLTFAQSELPENSPPIIIVKSPIEGQINNSVIINASISDQDGNITSIIWNQESEPPPVIMNISEDKKSMSFIPTRNITYVFSVEAIDDNGSTTLESVQVNVGQ
jgi:hypothetical protein